MPRETTSGDDEAGVAAAVSRWLDHFQSTLEPRASADDVADLMDPLSRDTAWLPHGGTGSWSRFYLIDDSLQARFDFDGRDELVSYSVHPTPEVWSKTPDGVLLQGSEAPDAEIRFIE